MARDDDIFADESCLGLFEVREGNRSVNLGGTRVPANFKSDASLLGIHEEPFVKGTFMVHGDFGVMTEKVRKALKDGRFRKRWR